MKIGLIVPLKAKAVSKNWQLVEDNLYQTLASIEGQTSTNFSAVVVGHDMPEIMKKKGYKSISFLPFSLRSPPKVDQIVENDKRLLEYEKDKFCKVLFGIEYLKNLDFSLTHWFILDADDLVRNDFIEVLTSSPLYDAYIMNRGYILYQNSNKINITNNFSAFCASSSIISTDLVGLPNVVNDSNFIESIYWKVSHVNLAKHLAKKVELKEIDQRVVMYVRDNGENVSRTENMPIIQKIIRTTKMYMKSTWGTRKIKAMFSMD